MNTSRWTTALALLALGACSTAPLSYLNDRQVTERTVISRVSVRVVMVDGISPVISPVAISPGVHHLVVAAAPATGFSVYVEKPVTMTIAPCTRYYIAGDRPNRLLPEWSFVVEDTAQVGGCDVQEEEKKARSDGRVTQGSGNPPESQLVVR
jgi:hypothetical protein